jgi:hypothetical protein
MTLILGDFRWLLNKGKGPSFDKKTEVVIRVTNGSQVLDLPVDRVDMGSKLVITCTLPKEKK